MTALPSWALAILAWIGLGAIFWAWFGWEMHHAPDLNDIWAEHTGQPDCPRCAAQHAHARERINRILDESSAELDGELAGLIEGTDA